MVARGWSQEETDSSNEDASPPASPGTEQPMEEELELVCVLFCLFTFFSSGAEGARLVGFEWEGLVVQQVERHADVRHRP